MDEYQLIEIAKRFRELEDAIKLADGLLVIQREDSIKRQLPELACTLDEVRGRLESTAEECRDDMVAMQEQIRDAK